jgi:gliding motility-associated-like protein
MNSLSKYLCLLFLSLGMSSYAQNHQPEVLSTAGDVGQFSGGYISFTIGEPLVQTYQDRNQIFTFGYQQPSAVPPCKVYIPNAFTPNSDGLNDTFYPAASCEFLDYSLHVYNRWGELIFEGNELNPEWDGYHKGELAPSGIYTYVFTYRLNRGYRNEYKAERGSLMLVK